MDGHEYITGKLIEARVAELRAAAARARLVSAHRKPWRPLRTVLGLGLMRLGSRIVGAGTTVAVSDAGHRRPAPG